MVCLQKSMSEIAGSREFFDTKNGLVSDTDTRFSREEW